MDSLDAAFITTKYVTTLKGANIPIYMLTDSKHLFDAMAKGKSGIEKRLMIDISSARHSHRQFEIRRIGLVKVNENPADVLSKSSLNKRLPEIFCMGKDNTPVE